MSALIVAERLISSTNDIKMPLVEYIRQTVNKYMKFRWVTGDGANNSPQALQTTTHSHVTPPPHNASSEIDRLILTAWLENLPLYMELPSYISYLEIEVPTSPLVLADSPSDQERLRSCIAAIAERLSA